jgi:TIR domain
MQEFPLTKIAVVGPESVHNMQLAQCLKKLRGNKNVFRYLELQRMVDFSSNHQDPNVIFLDLLGFVPMEAAQLVGQIRADFPITTFVLYIDKAEYRTREHELSSYWSQRFSHYIKLFKPAPNMEFEPIVRQILVRADVNSTQNHLMAKLLNNQTATSSNQKPVSTHTSPSSTTPTLEDMVFISYSRSDWDGFVSPMVDHLKINQFKVWIDQHLLVGGTLWMDEISQALEKCKVLALVVTPDALESKYVKMEYLYFFNYDKPIIPILLKPVDRMPPSLSLYQNIDFSKGMSAKVFQQLIVSLSQYLDRS